MRITVYVHQDNGKLVEAHEMKKVMSFAAARNFLWRIARTFSKYQESNYMLRARIK